MEGGFIQNSETFPQWISNADGLDNYLDFDTNNSYMSSDVFVPNMSPGSSCSSPDSAHSYLSSPGSLSPISPNVIGPPQCNNLGLFPVTQQQMDVASDIDIDALLASMDTDPLVRSAFNEGNNQQCVITIDMPQVARPRKRTRDGAGIAQNSTTIVPLPKEQLAVTSSAEFQAYCDQLEKTQPLTTGDRKILSAQRRQIKNREYAYEARKKKKQHMQELQARVDALEEENMRLKQENNSLKSKVIELVTGMRKLRGMVNNAGEAALKPAASLGSFASQMAQTVSNFTSIKSGGGTAATGTVLFILLLSVGFLFNFNSHASESSFGSVSTGRVILNADDSLSWWASIASFLWDSTPEGTNTTKVRVSRTTTTTTTVEKWPENTDDAVVPEAEVETDVQEEIHEVPHLSYADRPNTQHHPEL